MSNHSAQIASTDKKYRSPLVRCLGLGIGFLIGFAIRWQWKGDFNSPLLFVAMTLFLLGLLGVGITLFSRKIEQEQTESTE